MENDLFDELEQPEPLYDDDGDDGNNGDDFLS